MSHDLALLPCKLILFYHTATGNSKLSQLQGSPLPKRLMHPV